MDTLRKLTLTALVLGIALGTHAGAQDLKELIDEREWSAAVDKLKEARKDMLSQLKRLELEDKIEELQRLMDEASAAGRGSEAREYSKKIDKHEARLKKRGDRLEALPAVTRTFAYGILASFILSIAFFFLLAPLVMLMITGFFWEAWADGSEWLRSPGGMLAVIAGRSR